MINVKRLTYIKDFRKVDFVSELFSDINTKPTGRVKIDFYLEKNWIESTSWFNSLNEALIEYRKAVANGNDYNI
jgi:hypothetical protein